jgi:hypothetical protein
MRIFALGFNMFCEMRKVVSNEQYHINSYS